MGLEALTRQSSHSFREMIFAIGIFVTCLVESSGSQAGSSSRSGDPRLLIGGGVSPPLWLVN